MYVILALRDVQNLFLLVAERRLAAEVVSEEARVRLWILGLVDGDAVMEGLPQSVGAGSIGNSVEVRHRHQTEFPPQPFQSLSGILECREVEEVAHEGVCRGIVMRQSELLGGMEIDVRITTLERPGNFSRPTR